MCTTESSSSPTSDHALSPGVVHPPPHRSFHTDACMPPANGPPKGGQSEFLIRHICDHPVGLPSGQIPDPGRFLCAIHPDIPYPAFQYCWSLAFGATVTLLPFHPLRSSVFGASWPLTPRDSSSWKSPCTPFLPYPMPPVSLGPAPAQPESTLSALLEPSFHCF